MKAFYINSEGKVMFIPECPMEPNWGECANDNAMPNYYKALQSAKDSAIECADQMQAKKIIGDNLHINSAPTGYEPQTECLYPFPSDQYEVEVRAQVCEGCPYNCHPCPEGCSKKVAVITPSKER